MILHDLPAGWAWARLEELLAEPLANGRSVPTRDGGFQVLRLTALRDGDVDLAEAKAGDWTADEARPWLVEPGDFLVGRGNGSLSLVGRGGLVGAVTSPVAFPDTMIRVRPNSAALNSAYLRAVWHSPAVRHQLESSARTTAGIYKVNQATLKEIVIPLAPLGEQRRIAQYIADRLDALAPAIEALDALQRRMSHARRAVIRRVCLGGVGASDASRTEVGTTRLSLAGAGERLPTLPQSWGWSTLGELADVVGGVTKDAKKQDDPAYVEVPYLRVANVQEGALRLDSVALIRVPPAKAEALRLLPGDVLMNEGGDRDKLGRGWVWEGQIPDCIHQNHVFRARVRDKVIHPKLLSWHGNAFGRSWFEANGKQTTNLASISLTNVKRLPVPVPPMDEQTRMVEFIEGHLEMLDSAAAGISVLRQRCDALQRSIMVNAFAGGLGLHDEADEPAELLLKRIAQEPDGRASASRAKGRTVRKTRTTRGVKTEESNA